MKYKVDYYISDEDRIADIKKFFDFGDISTRKDIFVLTNKRNWELVEKFTFQSEQLVILRKGNFRILTLSRVITPQMETHLVNDFNVSILDIGKIYTTYDDFFKENKIDDTGYSSGFGDGKQSFSVIGYDYWKVVGFGKHRTYGNGIFVIEKEGRKILIGLEGIDSNFVSSFGKDFIKNIKQTEKFNDIWRKVL